MAKFGKWIGGGLGWVLGGGPIGGIIGFAIGSLFDNAEITTYTDETPQTGRYNTQPGDFTASLLVLSAAVMKSDGSAMRSELEYVRSFLENNFGKAVASQQMLVLREILKKEIPIADVCDEIKQHMSLHQRLQLIHYLFGICQADGHVHPKEVETVEQIARYLHINASDIASIRAMYQKDTTSDYRILEIDPSANDEEVKKAYRKMAVKHHPDKVSNLGEEVQKAAKEKFQKVQEAYESIKKQRGMV